MMSQLDAGICQHEKGYEKRARCRFLTLMRFQTCCMLDGSCKILVVKADPQTTIEFHDLKTFCFYSYMRANHHREAKGKSIIHNVTHNVTIIERYESMYQYCITYVHDFYEK